MKNSTLLEIKYAFIISIFTLLWLVFEMISGLQSEYLEWHAIVTNFSLLIPILGIWFAINEFKGMRVTKYTFQKGFGVGFRITLINTVLSLPIIYLFYEFVNPDWQSTMMEASKNKALLEGKNAEQAVEQARVYFSMKSYMIQAAIGTLIFGSIVSSVVAFVVKSRGGGRDSRP